MRWRRRGCRIFAVLSGWCCCAEPAQAQLVVVAQLGEAPAVEHAELAYAFGDGSPVTWLSLRVAQGPIAVVAALPREARARNSLDAWFPALEDSASPRALPPPDRTACGRAPSPVRVSWPRARGSAAQAELMVASAEDVAVALAVQGFSQPDRLPEASAYAIWSWSAQPGAYTTRTVRIEGGVGPQPLWPSGAFPVVVSALTPGAMSYAGERDKQLLDVTFLAGEHATSDYRDVAQQWLQSRPEPLVEMRGRGPLFDWTIYNDLLTLEPLVASYARRAADEAELADGRVADDVGVAFEAVTPERATLVRMLVSSAAGVEPALWLGGGLAVAPLIIAQRLDEAACSPAIEPRPVPVVPGPRQVGPAPPSGAAPPEQVAYEPGSLSSEPVELGCSGSPEPAPSGEPYDDEQPDIDCASDTSNSSDGDDPDCSSDTSGSSSEADCSSDTSSTSDSDESCSGDTATEGEDTSYDGDTCTGQAAPRTQRQALFSSDPGQVVRRPRPSRLKLSLWSLGLAAIVLPIRRRKRGNRRDG